MNRIVKRHYPVSKLPPELREGIEASGLATVTVEEELHREAAASLEEIFAARRPPYRTASEIDADISSGRDERER